jgi:hypothetical protein
MIDLTRCLKCDNFSEKWLDILTWLVGNIGPIKLSKLGLTQGQGWLIVRQINDSDSTCQYKLYLDEPNDELMFKLACL